MKILYYWHVDNRQQSSRQTVHYNGPFSTLDAARESLLGFIGYPGATLLEEEWFPIELIPPFRSYSMASDCVLADSFAPVLFNMSNKAIAFILKGTFE